MLTNLRSTLYLVAGVVGNIAYLPTLRDLWLLKPAANLQSHGIWNLTSLLVLADAVEVNGDLLFIALSCQTLCLCVAVVTLEFRRRRLQKRNQQEI